MEKSPIIDYSEYLSEDIQAVFFPNLQNDSPQSLLADLGLNKGKLATPEQIHSNTVQWVDSPGSYRNVDGLIAQNPDLVLNLRVADCVPVYLFAPVSEMIGLLHSGWRGTVGNIVTNAIQVMKEKGAIKSGIHCYLGPAIGKCCYEVDQGVATHFNAKAKVKLERRKWKVGLHEQIRLQLAAAGIPVANIQSSEICTYEILDYQSYRRDGNSAGRMVAFMRIKK